MFHTRFAMDTQVVGFEIADFTNLEFQTQKTLLKIQVYKVIYENYLSSKNLGQGEGSHLMTLIYILGG